MYRGEVLSSGIKLMSRSDMQQPVILRLPSQISYVLRYVCFLLLNYSPNENKQLCNNTVNTINTRIFHLDFCRNAIFSAAWKLIMQINSINIHAFHLSLSQFILSHEESIPSILPEFHSDRDNNPEKNRHGFSGFLFTPTIYKSRCADIM